MDAAKAMAVIAPDHGSDNIAAYCMNPEFDPDTMSMGKYAYVDLYINKSRLQPDCTSICGLIILLGLCDFRPCNHGSEKDLSSTR